MKPTWTAPTDIDLIATDIVRMPLGDDDPDWLFYKAIASALMAERERCATIAEDYDTGGYGEHRNMKVANAASTEIAALIRGTSSS